jgi:hypothetical protein
LLLLATATTGFVSGCSFPDLSFIGIPPTLRVNSLLIGGIRRRNNHSLLIHAGWVRFIWTVVPAVALPENASVQTPGRWIDRV